MTATDDALPDARARLPHWASGFPVPTSTGLPGAAISGSLRTNALAVS
jgi:hypothetical protein